MEAIVQDLRRAARGLAKTPGFTSAAILTLGLGLGAPTAVFGLVNAILLRPLPVASPGELVNIHRTEADGTGFHGFSFPNYRDLSARATATRVAAFNGTAVSLASGGPSELVGAQLVSTNYFDVLGLVPSLGRFFAPEETAIPAARAAVVVSHGLWQRRFGGDPALVGRTVTVNGQPFVVVGVAPRGFSGTFVGFPFDAWLPLAAARVAAPGHSFEDRGDTWLELTGRLASGVSRPQGAAELSTVAAHLAAEHPAQNRGMGVDVRRLTGVDDSLRGPVVALLVFLLAAGAAVLAIACVNVGGMLLARAAARRRAIAIRLALGADTAQVARPLLLETLLLFVGGAGAAAALAAAAPAVFRTFNLPGAIPLQLDFQPDGRVAAFGLALAAAAALMTGLGPALGAARRDVLAGLKESGPLASPRQTRLRRAVIAVQIAISAVLLVSAGLFGRTLAHAARVSAGFDVENVETLELTLSVLGLEEARGREITRDLLAGVSALPGVRSVSLASSVPLGIRSASFRVFGRSGGEETGLMTAGSRVAPLYFETLGIPLLAGRDFTAADQAGSAPAAILSETLARRLFADRSPLGQRVEIEVATRDGFRQNGTAPRTALEVVGVSRDVVHRRGGGAAEPFLYLAASQKFVARPILLVRTSGEASFSGRTLVEAVRKVLPNLPVGDAIPLRRLVLATLLPQRLAGSVAGALSALGLFLSATGLYGVLSHWVSQRTREIAVRMAIGARRADVMRLILGQGLRLALSGGAAGLLIALAAGRLLSSLLFGLSPADPLTFGAAAVTLVAVTLLAGFVPARRAMRLDPVTALRSE